MTDLWIYFLYPAIYFKTLVHDCDSDFVQSDVIICHGNTGPHLGTIFSQTHSYSFFLYYA